MQNKLIHLMPIALVAPMNQIHEARLGLWMGERLTGIQMLAARRRRARTFNPRRFEDFTIWSLPVAVQGQRRRAVG
jgi:hypothetical protein